MVRIPLTQWQPFSPVRVNFTTSESSELHSAQRSSPKSESSLVFDTHRRPSIMLTSGLGAWKGVGKEGNFSEHWVDGVFDQKLGAPLSDARYDHTTDTWSRVFHSGTVVKFNAKTNNGQIDWAGN